MIQPARALVVAAHPDDAEFMAGGTLAALTAGGADVALVVCTDGARGDDRCTLPAAELTALRRAEQRRAADVLRIGRIAFLGLPDGSLAAGPALRLAIAGEIRQARPDVVITHHPLRTLRVPIETSHPDHLAAGEAALAAACADAGRARPFPTLLAEGLAPHRTREVWLFGYQGADHFVDVSAHVDAKIESIRSHRSQLRDHEAEAGPRWVHDAMRQLGAYAGFAYAEGFVRLRLAWDGPAVGSCGASVRRVPRPAAGDRWTG